MAIALVVLPALSLVPYLSSGTELARARNAVVFHHLPRPAFEWSPEGLPDDWLNETGAVDPVISAAVSRLGVDSVPGDWDKAVAIARHLLGSGPVRDSGAIKAGLRRTYRRIVERGDGYCADYIRAFRAMAVASGLKIRTWAFSFDGFGGNGHIWLEVWSSERRQWILMDLYNNSVFHLAGAPLSAFQFRDALLNGDPDLRRERVHPDVRDGYADEDKAWRYYRRGISQWYMIWGLNPFASDAWMPAGQPGGVLYAAGQLAAIVAGVQPAAVALETSDNGREIDAMMGLRLHILVAGGLMCVGILGMGVAGVVAGLRRRAAS